MLYYSCTSKSFYVFFSLSYMIWLRKIVVMILALSVSVFELFLFLSSWKPFRPWPLTNYFSIVLIKKSKRRLLSLSSSFASGPSPSSRSEKIASELKLSLDSASYFSTIPPPLLTIILVPIVFLAISYISVSKNGSTRANNCNRFLCRSRNLLFFNNLASISLMFSRSLLLLFG